MHDANGTSASVCKMQLEAPASRWHFVCNCLGTRQNICQALILIFLMYHGPDAWVPSLQGDCLSQGNSHRGAHEWQIQIFNRIAMTSMVLYIFKSLAVVAPSNLPWAPRAQPKASLSCVCGAAATFGSAVWTLKPGNAQAPKTWEGNAVSLKAN